MIFSIRSGVFETNSSSMHSASLNYSDFNDQFIKNLVVDYGLSDTIELGIDDYGWGPDELDSWLEKADYLMVDNHSLSGVIIEAIKTKFPNINVKISFAGSIDHQSQGEIWSELFDEWFSKIHVNVKHKFNTGTKKLIQQLSNSSIEQMIYEPLTHNELKEVIPLSTIVAGFIFGASSIQIDNDNEPYYSTYDDF